MRIYLIRFLLTFVTFLIMVGTALDVMDISFVHGISLSIHSKIMNISQLFNSSLVALVIAALSLCFILPVLAPMYNFLAAFLAIGFCLFVHYFIGTDFSLLSVSIEFSVLTIILIFMIDILVGYLIELRAERFLFESFSQFIPPEVVRELIKNPDKIKVASEARTLSLLFCDIQNFSNVSEQIDSNQIVRLLNEYFDVMTEILFQHGATIDKYMGDEIMAFWNAPLDQPDHARSAVLSALGIHREIENLIKKLEAEGRIAPAIGTGINTGSVSVGNIGSKYRKNYTAIGDSVNIASRVEKLTRDYHVPIIISESTYNCLEDIVCRELDIVTVRGRHNPTRIFQPICLQAELDEGLIEELEHHKQAMSDYYNHDYDAAYKKFSHLSEQNTDDLYYQYMTKKVNDSRSYKAIEL